MDNSILGARLRKLRRERGMSQTELAVKLGLSNRHQIRHIERGQKAVQPPELLAALKALDTSFEKFSNPYLLGEEARFSWRLKP